MARKSKPGSSLLSDAAPAGLPADPRLFWRAAAALPTLHPPAEVDQTPTLKHLGPLPFAGSGFPLMGFLATLFESVANSAREELRPEEHSVHHG